MSSVGQLERSIGRQSHSSGRSLASGWLTEAGRRPAYEAYGPMEVHGWEKSTLPRRCAITRYVSPECQVGLSSSHVPSVGATTGCHRFTCPLPHTSSTRKSAL